jgi:hypothetical protein
MKYAIAALLGGTHAMRLKNQAKQGTNVPWDCNNSMYPENVTTCWADEAFQKCSGGQWAYDAVMQVGGGNRDAFDLMNGMVKGDCANCDVTKSGCENSMYPTN